MAGLFWEVKIHWVFSHESIIFDLFQRFFFFYKLLILKKIIFSLFAGR